jgi:hypothetical protein
MLLQPLLLARTQELGQGVVNPVIFPKAIADLPVFGPLNTQALKGYRVFSLRDVFIKQLPGGKWPDRTVVSRDRHHDKQD